METDYKRDVMLHFMCGTPKEWEKEIKDVRPDTHIRWESRRIASVSSETKSVVGIVDEIYKKIYEPINDIYPCIEYCRSELVGD